MAKRVNRIVLPQFIRRLFIRRKYRDFLFRRVFSDKKDILSLYNALNGTNYTNPNELEITTLEDAIFMSMKNDLSFIVSMTLNLYEHQSTINENMPLRGLMYFAKSYEAYVKMHKYDIYSSKMIDLPTPQYVIFYNGSKSMPDEKILKLSDAFNHKNSKMEPCLECKARLININYGHNVEIMNICKRLHDYSYFISEVDKNILNGMVIQDAIAEAMNICIEEGILEDILVKNQAEVFDMLLFCYDEKLHKKVERQEAREEGREEGIKEGIKEGEKITIISMIIKKVNKGKSLNEIADELELPEKDIETYYNVINNNKLCSAEEINEMCSRI